MRDEEEQSSIITGFEVEASAMYYMQAQRIFHTKHRAKKLKYCEFQKTHRRYRHVSPRL